MIAVIIAGGKGTRLGLKDIPKPMVMLDGKPLLEHQIALLKKYNIRKIFILSGYLSNVIFDHFKLGEDFGVEISHIIEPYPLGTAGCIKLLEHIIHERFLVFYGDIALDMDINNLLQFDEKYQSTATIVVHPNDHPYDSDLLEINNCNKITCFHSKPHNSNFYYKNLVNAGVYILSPLIYKYIPIGKSSDFGKDIFPIIISQNGNMHAYITAEYIKDLGTPERLIHVENDLQKGKIARLNYSNKRNAIFIDRDGVINKFVDNLSSIDQFELLPDVAEAIRKINNSEYLAIVITNQPMIAKGFLTEIELHKIHNKMEWLLGVEHAFLNAIFYCPHHQDKGYPGEIPELKMHCSCRKPNPGLMLQASQEFNINIEKSWMIGDSDIDIMAGQNAGCKTIGIKNQIKLSVIPDEYAVNLNDAIDIILKGNY